MWATINLILLALGAVLFIVGCVQGRKANGGNFNFIETLLCSMLVLVLTIVSAIAMWAFK